MFVRVHQKGKMPTEKIEMHQLRMCVAMTQLFNLDLRLASSMLSPLKSAVGREGVCV